MAIEDLMRKLEDAWNSFWHLLKHSSMPYLEHQVTGKSNYRRQSRSTVPSSLSMSTPSWKEMKRKKKTF